MVNIRKHSRLPEREADLRSKDTGAVTIAQDEASSAVHGIPGEANRLGAANHVLSPERIAAAPIHLGRSLRNEPWTHKRDF